MNWYLIWFIEVRIAFSSMMLFYKVPKPILDFAVLNMQYFDQSYSYLKALPVLLEKVTSHE